MPDNDSGFRRLTEADVQSIADEMERRMVHRFYTNLGRGVWGVAWRVMVIGVLLVAAYGAAKGIK